MDFMFVIRCFVISGSLPFLQHSLSKIADYKLTTLLFLQIYICNLHYMICADVWIYLEFIRTFWSFRINERTFFCIWNSKTDYLLTKAWWRKQCLTLPQRARNDITLPQRACNDKTPHRRRCKVFMTLMRRRRNIACNRRLWGCCPGTD